MTANGWLQFVAFFGVLLLLMRPLGLYIARVVEGEKTFLDPLLRPIERLFYRVCGIQADQEMSWQQYSVAMLIVSFVSLLLTYVIERAQSLLPWNPPPQNPLRQNPLPRRRKSTFRQSGRVRYQTKAKPPPPHQKSPLKLPQLFRRQAPSTRRRSTKLLKKFASTCRMECAKRLTRH